MRIRNTNRHLINTNMGDYFFRACNKIRRGLLARMLGGSTTLGSFCYSFLVDSLCTLRSLRLFCLMEARHPEIRSSNSNRPSSAPLFCIPKNILSPNSLYTSHFRIDKKYFENPKFFCLYLATPCAILVFVVKVKGIRRA